MYSKDALADAQPTLDKALILLRPDGNDSDLAPTMAKVLAIYLGWKCHSVSIYAAVHLIYVYLCRINTILSTRISMKLMVSTDYDVHSICRCVFFASHFSSTPASDPF